MFHGTKLVCFTQKNFVKKLSILCKIYKFFLKVLCKITKLEYSNKVSQVQPTTKYKEIQEKNKEVQSV